MIILSFIFGVLIGNYATTLLFRIPLGIEICGINKNVNTPPHCSTCSHSLKFYEYLPVLSWVFSRFKCNYCGVKINPQYFFLEFSTAIASMIIYSLIGLSEIYILLVILWVSTTLSGLIQLNSGKIYRELTFATISLGMVYRTLLDGSILPFITDIAISSICLSFVMKTSKFQIKELIHLILQSSVFGLVQVSFVLITYIISHKFFGKKSYLYSLTTLSCVTILRNIF